LGRITLTDRFIKSRKPAPKGKRADFFDAIVPGLALRVTDRGAKSFVLVARYPLRPQNPTRRALGGYGPLTLDAARDKARNWLELIGRGIDPRIAEERERVAQLKLQAATFQVVATSFLDRYAASLAKAKEARSIIEGEFVPRWRWRPAAEIEPQEVAVAVRAIADRGAPYQAHNAFGLLRRLYNWAIAAGEFGLTSSPLERLSPLDVIGVRREARSRILTDDELREVWEAAKVTGYPYGPIFQLLIITGQRLSEVAKASRSEIDLKRKLWTIPKERMKGDRAHEVPLSSLAIEVIEDLPNWNSGEFLFSSTAGEKPINGFSKPKVRIDLAIAEARIKAGRQKKDGKGAMPPWVLHDLRRTVRTHLSTLPVQDLVRELVIAHAKPGLHKVYDQHAYLDEKRECLNLWCDRLSAIAAVPRD
jgi:integrase